jgi:ribose/xylose/arabinose/galactoside ABC-type transport system permease subunit
MEKTISKNNLKNSRNININSILVISIAFIAVVAISIFAKGFFSLRNLSNVLYQVSALGILVLGITPVIIIGQIDLSLAIMMTTSAIIGVYTINKTGNIALGIVTTLAVGIAVGAFNGLFIGKLKVVSFIVTLAVMIVGGGLAVLITMNKSVANLPAAYTKIGQGKIGIVPIPFFIFLFLAICTHFLLNNHYIGRWVYSIGSNEKASKFCGIPIDLTIFLIFVFAGLMAGLSGVIQSAKLGSASASMGRQGVILDYIAAATMGGVSIRGGKGTILNAILGTFFIVIISNSMNLLGVAYYVTLIIKGVIIVFIVALDNINFDNIKLRFKAKKAEVSNAAGKNS